MIAFAIVSSVALSIVAAAVVVELREYRRTMRRIRVMKIKGLVG